MTVYVMRDGKLVERTSGLRQFAKTANFPSPAISRIEPFESPVTGKEITSWRERDRDMAAADAVDPRDMPAATRGRASQKKEVQDATRRTDDTFKWGDPAASS